MTESTVIRTYRMALAYDGGAFAGWQVQPDQVTVQGELESAIKRVSGRTVRVTGSGRTDAGVHARRQVASFQLDTRLSPTVLRRAINAETPPSLFVWELLEAPDGFHAIRAARSKQYRYLIQDGSVRDVFLQRYAWQLHETLQVETMQQAADLLVGEHDFRCFEASGAPRRSSVRHVTELRLIRRPSWMAAPIWLEIRANGFLYNMVRNIVGTLVDVGRGRESVAWVAEVLAAADRRAAGPTAPAHGLVLWEVDYGPEYPWPSDGGGDGRCHPLSDVDRRSLGDR